SRLGLIMNGLLKVPMQFLILLIGVLVFAFYQFNKPPMFFNQYEVKQVKQSEYGGQYVALEGKYDNAFEQRKAKANELITAIDSKDKSSIDQAQANLKVADLAVTNIRKESISLMKK